MSDGDAIVLRRGRYRAVMQWALRDYGPMDCSAQIQVGELTGGTAGWFVDHAGFGTRRFGDKHAAWTAIQRLMGLHKGRWEQVPIDRRPFFVVRRSDGSRVLYCQADGDSLFGHWGRLRDRYWDLYGKAHEAGTVLRSTESHSGGFSVTEYTDPLDGSVRYWLDMVRGDADWRVVDYTGRALAEKRYEQCVENSAGQQHPYLGSDVDGVPVNRKAPEHPGMRRLPGGAYVAEADLTEYRKLYGPIPRGRRDR
ncbi:hypothetical protein ACIBCM_13250 [Streptomyces sp. NPDC051018]|uniref:hypothetical protein n=1 Tax=Streptomyces sp. NPDC051018 TaxID=3365639 RepID=UPI003796346D